MHLLLDPCPPGSDLGSAHVVYDRDWTWWLGEATSLLLLAVVLTLTTLLVLGWRKDQRLRKGSS